jgi:hypothetical protein
VQILGIDENVFWFADITSIDRIVENKTAYDSWLSGVVARERERNGSQCSQDKIYRRHEAADGGDYEG